MWAEFAQQRLKVVGSEAPCVPMGYPLPDAFESREAEACDLGLWMGSRQVQTSLWFAGTVWKLEGQREVTATTLTLPGAGVAQ